MNSHQKPPKTIRIFLKDGDPSGRLMCELSNWTGRAYKIPRTLVPESAQDIPELKNKACIYLLFGRDEKADADCAYIGETEELFVRLKDHIDKKEFWNEAIVFFSKDDVLNKAHIKYAESCLHRIAKKCGRYKLDNSNEPRQSNLSEADSAEMDEFIHNLQILVNTLGHRIFEEKRKTIHHEKEKKQMVFQMNGNGYEARGMRTEEGFVVLSGSKIAIKTAEKAATYIVAARERLLKSSAVIKEENCYELHEDMIFASPTAAAQFGATARLRNEKGVF